MGILSRFAEAGRAENLSDVAGRGAAGSLRAGDRSATARASLEMARAGFKAGVEACRVADVDDNDVGLSDEEIFGSAEGDGKVRPAIDTLGLASAEIPPPVSVDALPIRGTTKGATRGESA